MKKITRIFSYVTLGVLAAIITVGDIIAYQNNGVISSVLGGNTVDFTGSDVENASQIGDALCQEIEEQGIVLLKNDKIDGNNYSLPLTSETTKVNVFGWAAPNFLLKGVGSGSSSINEDKAVSFLDALDNYGIEYNHEIINAYNGISAFNDINGKPISILEKNKAEDYYLYQATANWHKSYMTNAKSFSDTAIFVIHRVGGENLGSNEIPTSQTLVTEDKNRTTDSSRTYLETTKHEEEIIDLLHENFKNVILVVNSTNTMHLGCLKDDRIKSCIYVGITGQSGANAIPEILWGAKKVDGNVVKLSPSGKVSDTYAYDPETSPSFANREKKSNHIQYLEDIYYGYKWFETADEEGYWDDVSNSYGQKYDGVVQFPFGFGLSYSKFSWELDGAPIVSNLNGDCLSATSTITYKVKVTNTGEYPARDVVELYVSPSYKPGEIEKPSILLMDFEKTDILNPGDSQVLTLSFDCYDMASYDCYDDNNNEFMGYEVDYAKDGIYTVSLRSDVHNLKDMSDATFVLKVPENGIKFDKDPVSNNKVENHMTGDNAYASTPIDGSNVGASTNYLSRSNFKTLFPKEHAVTPTGTNDAEKYVCKQFDTDELVNASPVDSGLRIVTLKDGNFASLEQLSGKTDAELVANLELIADLANYDSQTWEKFLNQISIEDLCSLVENGGFHTYPIESIGKPRAYDTDGPAGFNRNTLSIGDGDPTKWTAYPSETLLGCTWSKELCEKMGLAMGLEGQATAVQGWYAPGVNIHRTPYTARNYEYYSEDPMLSGILAAKVIEGAKTNGVYCYLKHFVLSEPGPNPRALNTWVTEQNLRENYLKPFEIAVKKGGANGIMSAFNRVGSVWAGASYPCLTQILRNEWGFKGSVITDYAMANDTGTGSMNPTQGVKAGNDLWLNPNDGTITNRLNRRDASTVAAARNAAKNILFTYIDTYNYGSNHVAKYENYNAIIGIKVLKSPSTWWIPTLIAIEAVLVAACCVWVVFAIKSAVFANNGGTVIVKAPKEKKPFYITKRLARVFSISIILGSIMALLCVILIPLFNDILTGDGKDEFIVPVDTGVVVEKRFEFEQGLVNGTTKGEDHLCIPESYFFNFDLSKSGAIYNLNNDSTIEFEFSASESYQVSLNLRMASVFDNETNTWKEAKLSDCMSIFVNDEELNLTDVMIPVSNKTLSDTNSNEFNMVDVVGTVTNISKIDNKYVFKLKENCPALDYFSIYTSANIQQFDLNNVGKNNPECIDITTCPTTINNGKLSLNCSNENCSKENEFEFKLLTKQKWYKYNSTKNSYTFDAFGKEICITPDKIGTPIGAIHSESKTVNNFKGENFFSAANWEHRNSSSSQKKEDYTYSKEDIIDKDGNIFLTHDTYAKTNVFYCDSQDRKPLSNYTNAQNKNYLGKPIVYEFTVNPSGDFVLSALSTVYSAVGLVVSNSVPGIFFNFDASGNVSLTIGVNTSDGSAVNPSNFKTSKNVITAPTALQFNQDNVIKFDMVRTTAEHFELALYINDVLVNFPEIPSTDTNGKITTRYTENGKLIVEQDENSSYQFGEYISFAPGNDKIVVIKDLQYRVGE